ncbi:MAG: hypothetical protein ACKVWV_10220 [Planctomycetota bacterium]
MNAKILPCLGFVLFVASWVIPVRADNGNGGPPEVAADCVFTGTRCIRNSKCKLLGGECTANQPPPPPVPPGFDWCNCDV